MHSARLRETIHRSIVVEEACEESRCEEQEKVVEGGQLSFELTAAEARSSSILRANYDKHEEPSRVHAAAM